MRLKLSIILTISLFFSSLLKAQDRSNRGKEFWLAYGFDYSFFHEVPVNEQELAIYISAEAAATVTVSITNTGFSQTLTIPANTVDATILIPKSGVNDARTLTDGLQNRGIHIVSDVPVAVYAHVYATQVSGATMLMPVDTYGYTYRSINYYQTKSQSNPADWYSWFYAIASEDNTRLEITPSDTTKNGWLPGQTYTVNLNKGESYHVFGKAIFGGDPAKASKDMTGSKIVSVIGADGRCHPVAVFSGSGGIRLCRGDGGEFMHQQVFPAQAWGNRYLTYHTINNTNTNILETNRNYYRVCVEDPTSVVKKNGIVMTGLINNFFYEYMDSTGGDYIESDKPILVAQYMVNKNQCWNFPTTSPSPPSYGDPEMFYLSPIEQGQKSVLFYTSRNRGIDYVYANIHLPTTAVPSLRVDGNTLPTSQVISHPNYPGYSVALARFIGPSAQHTIVSDSTFNATVYGLGNYESYGYNVGTLVNNLNSYGGIKNTFNTTGQIDTFTCLSTPARLFAKIAFPAEVIHWHLSQIPGISPNTDSIINNPVPVRTEIINGRTYYVYTLQQDFTFSQKAVSIPISYTSTVIPNCFQTENAFLKISVKDGPKADFTISNQLCLTDTVQFTGNTSTVNGQFNYTNYQWDFDDATTQNTINAKKRFATTGNHPVRYRVYADNGCIGDTIKTVNIVNGSAPALSVTASGRLCADSTITLTSSIAPNSSNPTTWYWDFGGGQTFSSATVNTVTRSFAAGTNFSIRHAAALTNGCQPDTITHTIPVIHANPIAVFSYVADTLCPGKPVQLLSSATGVNTWNWNFGNGTGAQVPPFIYRYTNAGSYDIKLTITDINGCSSLPHTEQIDIMAAPSVNAGPDKYISVGTSTTLDASIASPSNYTFLWSPPLYLSDVNILNPTCTPDYAPMTYTITVTDNTNLCTAKDDVIITPVSKIYIPTGFTPNNDGKNDKWVIPGLALYPDAVVTVYNRWGEKIFETKNYINNPWSGQYKKLLQPAGTYVYTVQLNDDKKQFYKGTVTLIW